MNHFTESLGYSVSYHRNDTCRPIPYHLTRISPSKIAMIFSCLFMDFSYLLFKQRFVRQNRTYSHIFKMIFPSALRRHGIVSVSPEWMATQQAPRRQNRPLDRPVDLQRFNRIVRTARFKPATPREERRKDNLIRPHEKNQHLLHEDVFSDTASSIRHPTLRAT